MTGEHEQNADSPEAIESGQAMVRPLRLTSTHLLQREHRQFSRLHMPPRQGKNSRHQPNYAKGEHIIPELAGLQLSTTRGRAGSIADETRTPLVRANQNHAPRSGFAFHALMALAVDIW